VFLSRFYLDPEAQLHRSKPLAKLQAGMSRTGIARELGPTPIRHPAEQELKGLEEIDARTSALLTSNRPSPTQPR